MQPTAEMQAVMSKMKQQLELKTIQSVPVVHCAHAYAIALEGLSGWKVAFSGDTRPCEHMVEAAREATLHIHEVCYGAIKLSGPFAFWP